MKRIVSVLFIALILCSTSLKAQRPAKDDFDFSLGATLFFGDLGGANYIGRPLFFDLEGSLIKPVVMLSWHHQFSLHFATRLQAAYTGIGGDDKLIQPKAVYAPEWYRWYRNLNFHSKLWETSFQMELYFIKYQPGDLQLRWGPYFLVGAGLFHFNPMTYDTSGAEVELRPLHTEGEGFPGTGVKEYNEYQLCIPIGFGIRYNVSTSFTLGIEYADRKTFTDYIDDVSTEYIDPALFDANLDPTLAAEAKALNVRSDELDPDGVYSHVTAPGAQRGDKKDLDHYIFPMTFCFCYVIGQRHVISKKSQLKCMKWGGAGGEAGTHHYKH